MTLAYLLLALEIRRPNLVQFLLQRRRRSHRECDGMALEWDNASRFAVLKSMS